MGLIILPGAFTCVVGPRPWMSELWLCLILVPAAGEKIPGMVFLTASTAHHAIIVFWQQNYCIASPFYAYVSLLMFATQDVPPVLTGWFLFWSFTATDWWPCKDCFSSSFCFSLTAVIAEFIFFHCLHWEGNYGVGKQWGGHWNTRRWQSWTKRGSAQDTPEALSLQHPFGIHQFALSLSGHLLRDTWILCLLSTRTN